MKYRYTRDRKRDREEFAYMYRKEIAMFQNRRLNDPELMEWVRNVARPHMGYSARTNDVDVWLSISKTLSKLPINGN